MLPHGYTDLTPGKIASVVTFLEMRARPPAPQHDASYRIERTVLEAGEYLSLFRAIGEDYLWFSRLALLREDLAAILTDPLVETHVLYDEAQPAGLLELDRRVPGDIEIAFFGITKPLFGTGAAGALLQHALEVAWSYRPERVWLHTCTLDHPRALGFYLRAGFVPYKRAVEIAHDPRILGVLPRAAAPQVPLL